MKSKYIAENGILVALTLAILSTASIIPINTLSILTVSSFLIPVSIIRSSIKYAIMVYFASSIASFFLIPTNISLYYTLFFGIYGLVKYFAEKIKIIPLELVFKLISLNILLVLIYFVTLFFIGLPTIQYPLYILWGISQIGFLIYDYALTILISFYLKRIHKHI